MAVIRCPNCNRFQKDQGQRISCQYCGCQPLPSYSYSSDSAFYPKKKEKPLTPRAAKALLRASKEERGG